MKPPSRSLTRRRLLQTTGGALLAGAAAQLGAAEAPKKKVIVIGGGIGGLSCAFDLMERGHDVTVLEASRRTGGHVKTIYDPLPDGLYADVGAEQFTNPGYVDYRKWVKKFDLPFLAYPQDQRQMAHRGGTGGCEDAARVRFQ